MLPPLFSCKCKARHSRFGAPGRGILPMCAFCMGIIDPEADNAVMASMSKAEYEKHRRRLEAGELLAAEGQALVDGTNL